MKEWTLFRMNDFLGNAGIIGLLKLLNKIDSKAENYKIEDMQVEVRTKLLLETDLTGAYFDTLIDEYEEECIYNRILKKIILLIQEENKQDKNYQKELKALKKDLESNRYKTGYETIKDKLDTSNDLYEELKRLLVLKESDEITECLLQINTLLNHKIIKETFYMKDIAYFIINNFWESKSFLNRNNTKKDMKEVHRAEIEEVLKQYLKAEDKGKNICVECGDEISGKSSISSSFINDFSEDFARKNSNYWNFKPNCFFCPKCLFLYTLIPLGFTKMGQNFLFINANDSLENLIFMNSGKLEVDEQKDNNNYHYLYNQVLQTLNEKNIGRVSNIQVITRSIEENEYRFDIINNYILTLLGECKKELQQLSKYSYIKDTVGYRNIYEEVLLHLLYNQELYRLLNELLCFGLNTKNEYVIHSCKLIYQIEERKKNMINKTNKNYYRVARDGNEYRKSMEINGKDDATVGISYKMLNALKCQDCNQFLDIVIRLSNSLKRNVPKGLIATLNDIEEFKRIGYAFVLLFRGGYYTKDENEQELDGQLLEEKMNQEFKEGGEENE